jgi:hypothetical protein
VHGDVTAFAAHGDAELQFLTFVNASATAGASALASLLLLLSRAGCSTANAQPVAVQGVSVQAFTVGVAWVLAALAVDEKVAVMVAMAEAAGQAVSAAGTVFFCDLIALIIQDDGATALPRAWWWCRVIRHVGVEQRFVRVGCRRLVSMVTVVSIVAANQPGVAVISVAVYVVAVRAMFRIRSTPVRGECVSASCRVFHQSAALRGLLLPAHADSVWASSSDRLWYMQYPLVWQSHACVQAVR